MLLIKGIIWLISKGMSDIHLKVTIEKSWFSQNFNFVNLKNYPQVSFWGAPAHVDIIEF